MSATLAITADPRLPYFTIQESSGFNSKSLRAIADTPLLAHHATTYFEDGREEGHDVCVDVFLVLVQAQWP
ncbi:hypothetical protein ON010_g2357 [Phytophthora cinnamomi]|nr:hypothetical protein ON010_g2357 [Phytophthora cinnamomi]